MTADKFTFVLPEQSAQDSAASAQIVEDSELATLHVIYQNGKEEGYRFDLEKLLTIKAAYINRNNRAVELEPNILVNLDEVSCMVFYPENLST